VPARGIRFRRGPPNTLRHPAKTAPDDGRRRVSPQTTAMALIRKITELVRVIAPLCHLLASGASLLVQAVSP
jgi:hypothetical protein